MNKNDILKVEITNIASSGDGIARYDNIVIFIPNTAIGDILYVKIIKLKKNYAIGKIEKLIEYSKDRVASDCPLSEKCGGCAFRHISYEAELDIKQKIVFDALEKFTELKSDNLNKIMQSIIGSDNLNRYRNKVQVPLGIDQNNNISSGFFSKRSHKIIPTKDCKLHPEIFNNIISIIIEFIDKEGIPIYNELKNSGTVRHIYIRYAESTHEISVGIVVTNYNKFTNKSNLVDILVKKFPDIVSIYLNKNSEKTNVILGENNKLLYGKEFISDKLCGLTFDISNMAFYQVNHSQTEKLYKVVSDMINSHIDKNILDMYCGIGSIGLSLCKNQNKLLGIEIIEDAVKNAKNNAIKNNINADFVCCDSKKVLETLRFKKFNPDVVVIDPPRKGCTKEVIDSILDISPPKIIYVSCNPSTLARDVNKLIYERYKACKVVPVDMFPRTTHVETVVLLSRT